MKTKTQPNENKKRAATVARLMRYLKPHSPFVALAFLCAAISSAGQILAPVIIGRAVGCIVGAGDVNFDKLAFYACILAGIIGAVMLFQWQIGRAHV